MKNETDKIAKLDGNGRRGNNNDFLIYVANFYALHIVFLIASAQNKNNATVEQSSQAQEQIRA